MRTERGLPPIEFSGEPWQPGDYAKFIPDFMPAPTVERRRGDRNAGWKALVALVIAVGLWLAATL